MGMCKRCHANQGSCVGGSAGCRGSHGEDGVGQEGCWSSFFLFPLPHHCVIIYLPPSLPAFPFLSQQIDKVGGHCWVGEGVRGCSSGWETVTEH